MNDFKVNLFIVGAAKCGTTYLAEYLDQHSEINMASIKEPDYFSHKLLSGKVDYYETKPVTNIENYKDLFDTGKPHAYHGEASVSYLPYKRAAQNIYDYNPAARIIILLRNPVERAFSHYKMDKRLGLTKSSFIEIVNQQSQSKWQDQFYHQYIELGFYHEQIAAYLKLFGSRQVYCMIDSTELDKKLTDIFDFLELSPEPILQKRANEAISFKNPILSRLYANLRVRKVLKKIVPSYLVKRIKKEEELLDEVTRRYLENLYSEDQLRLKTLLSNA